jgi:hypothetical protein
LAKFAIGFCAVLLPLNQLPTEIKLRGDAGVIPMEYAADVNGVGSTGHDAHHNHDTAPSTLDLKSAVVAENKNHHDIKAKALTSLNNQEESEPSIWPPTIAFLVSVACGILCAVLSEKVAIWFASCWMCSTILGALVSGEKSYSSVVDQKAVE